jgi:hypothetical protein
MRRISEDYPNIKANESAKEDLLTKAVVFTTDGETGSRYHKVVKFINLAGLDGHGQSRGCRAKAFRREGLIPEIALQQNMKFFLGEHTITATRPQTLFFMFTWDAVVLPNRRVRGYVATAGSGPDSTA